MIKAIETLYKGYRFRSRLEARWAVFFDQMGIKYEYESQGYELEGGVKYLPDFYLPEFSLFVEVKPNEQIDRLSWRKIVSLATSDERGLLLIVGSPGEHQMYLMDRTATDNWSFYESIDDDDEITEAIFDSIKDWSNVRFGAIPRLQGWQIVYQEDPPIPACDLSLAIATAKQSRFEHGQSGAPKK